jgi:hypothetical protein
MDCAMRVISSRASMGTREVQVALAG